MSTNEIFENGKRLRLVPSHPSVVTSGLPVIVGQIPAVAETAEGSDTAASLHLQGVYDLSVKGIDQSGNSAVAVGDILYYTGADTPPLSKKNTGVRFGYALETVASAGTDTVRVLLGY